MCLINCPYLAVYAFKYTCKDLARVNITLSVLNHYVPPHSSVIQIFLAFLISDSWWEEFGIRSYDPVQSLVSCPD